MCAKRKFLIMHYPLLPKALSPVSLPLAVPPGDDRSVKIKSLEAAKIMKIKWLVLGCIEAKFCK